MYIYLLRSAFITLYCRTYPSLLGNGGKTRALHHWLFKTFISQIKTRSQLLYYLKERAIYLVEQALANKMQANASKTRPP